MCGWIHRNTFQLFHFKVYRIIKQDKEDYEDLKLPHNCVGIFVLFVHILQHKTLKHNLLRFGDKVIYV